MRSTVAIWAFLLLTSWVSVADSAAADHKDERVKEATDLILTLCLAGGIESIAITKKGDSIEVAGRGNSVEIDRKESSGLVGGISKELTTISAQQASEARSCTQKYLRDLLNLILTDLPPNATTPSDKRSVTRGVTLRTDPEAYWSGKGIWEDNKNYCKSLLDFISASDAPENFVYAESGQRVSATGLSTKPNDIVGNYFMRTDQNALSRYCAAFNNKTYNAVFCSRPVAYERPDVFASVYNQTLKDIRDCLLPAGWQQTTPDQGVCIPSGATLGECVRRFSKGPKNIWLFSHVDAERRYTVGIQTELGP